MSWTQKFFSFEGRLGRQDFWICTLILWGFTVASWIVAWIFMWGPLTASMSGGEEVKASDPSSYNAIIYPILLIGLVQLAQIWPSLAVNAKRLHDRGQSGWLVLIFVASAVLSLIPMVGILVGLGVTIWWLINLGILPGDPGPNRYGHTGASTAEVFA